MNIPEIFGINVFGDKAMRERLPKDIYKTLKAVTNGGKLIEEPHLADIVANAMKEWALERGATHYTHWFQPMTGITAEKHDSFITPTGDGGVIMNFSGKALIKGEPDASSFPNGGLRSTFEARGYTAWDPTCPAFVKDGTLCIPTAFCSYSGQVLDKKTPLLRSIRALKKAALRLMKFFDNPPENVDITCGAEQEYFLIDRDLWLKRKDLMFTGRTLFGAKPPKGQEMSDHYFGNIKPRVIAFMQELDEELWKLGILAKTRHNEVAPAQHELAPIFTSVNVATDQNQLTMEIMKKVALKHNLFCLLHEKPFAGVNGSGKHNNWSIMTDSGENLLRPGKNPETNYRFLLILTAIIKAVHEHQDLLRISAASAGNDHRLGANEAPPAIVSMFIGSELKSILDSMQDEEIYFVNETMSFKTGVDEIPEFKKDTTDRNRTSPFAFTGDKFEFRMLGSAFNIACTNVMLNTIIADVFDSFADELENAEDVIATVKELIKTEYAAHKDIVFNGNNYSAEWEAEAEQRGLLNLRSTPDALILYNSRKNLELFARHNIYTKEEVESRQEILLSNYCKVLNIEVLTAIDMAKREILPSIAAYSRELAETVCKKRELDMCDGYEEETLARLHDLSKSALALCERLAEENDEAKSIKELSVEAFYYRDTVIKTMEELRACCDEAETLTAQRYWAFPTYDELLFSV